MCQGIHKRKIFLNKKTNACNFSAYVYSIQKYIFACTYIYTCKADREKNMRSLC